MDNMEFIELSDLYLAYKKAKSDAFFESVHFDALAFSQYEESLHKNLVKLQKGLASRTWWRDASKAGGYLFAPKSLSKPDDAVVRQLHFSTLDPSEDWRNSYQDASKKPKAEFRLVMSASVDYQIVSALWILKVGHIFEGTLNKDLSYGNRLRRHASWRDPLGEGSVNRDSLGLFSPYFSAYQAWKEKGLNAMRAAAAAGKTIIAATMDARRYYHNVSPEFLLRSEYLDAIGVTLTSEQVAFTRLFIDSLNAWYKSTPDYRERPEGALPVGLSASKVIANVALSEFDKRVQEALNPEYYGRYVDDIFIVVEAPVGVDSSAGFFGWLCAQFGRELKFDAEKSVTSYAPTYLADSRVEFSQDKQKVFRVSGNFGLDLVGQIEQQIRRRSSEYRLLPVLPESTEGMLDRALLTSSDASLEADALRKADAVSIRRLGFAMLLGDVEAHARDLTPSSWRKTRQVFYGIVERYVITPTGIFDYFNYIIRVVGLAVACGDAARASSMIEKFDATVRLVREIAAVDSDKLDRMVQLYARNLFQVSLQSSTIHGFKFNPSYIALMKRIKKLSQIQTPSLSKTPLKEASLRLLFADMGRRPYKEMWIHHPSTKSPRSPRVPSDLAVQRELRLGGLRRFTGIAERDYKKIYWPGVAFATRPLTAQEITAVAPGLLQSSVLLKSALFALRGARTKDRGLPSMAGVKDRPSQVIVSVPKKAADVARIAIVSYLTEQVDWDAALTGRPNRTVQRYKRFNGIINAILSSENRVDYVVFPEASVPRQWAFSASTKLAKSGVSFLAGLENHVAAGPYHNDAIVSLHTRWPGYNTNITYIQPKILPAHEERKALENVGRELRAVDLPRARPIQARRSLLWRADLQ